MHLSSIPSKDRAKMRTSSALSFLAFSAFVLAASVAAEDYSAGGKEQPQEGGYLQPAYQKPVDGLDYGYYSKSCPDMEGIVQRAVKKAFSADYTIAAGLIRLFFHDFAVRGIDGSVLIDGQRTEKHAAASKTLRGFEVIEAIKTELEAKCPTVVSCADILTAAARDASSEVGVGYWRVVYGRKDGGESRAEEADRYVPMGRESITGLVSFFESRGLNVVDLVALSGAHTIGRATCGAVKPRLCGDDLLGSCKPDGPINCQYADFLRRKCHRDDAEYVELDAETPTTFDNKYYDNLLRKMGLLETDQKMRTDSRTRSFVEQMAGQPEVFKHQFARSMKKLGEVLVLTGKEGGVRQKCSAASYW